MRQASGDPSRDLVHEDRQGTMRPYFWRSDGLISYTTLNIADWFIYHLSSPPSVVSSLRTESCLSDSLLCFNSLALIFIQWFIMKLRVVKPLTQSHIATWRSQDLYLGFSCSNPMIFLLFQVTPLWWYFKKYIIWFYFKTCICNKQDVTKYVGH